MTPELIVAQVWLLLFSVTAVALSQSTRPNLRRYACICGLLSQPAWFYSMWVAGHFGTFALCFVYAAIWAKGFHNFWIRKVEA